MKRIVFDTNITISTLFWKGHPRTIFDLVREGKAVLLSSEQIESELIRVLAYSKFGLIPSEILPIVNNVRKHTQLIEVKSKVDLVKEDLTDNIFLECALDGKADYIISGDRHLLKIGSYQGIQIIRAKDFLIKEGFILSEGNN